MNMKKVKLFSGLVAAAMAAVSMGTVFASAADDVTLKVGSATANPGEKFSVTVDLGSVPSSGLSSIDFAISYDASLISIDSIEAGSILNTGASSQEGDYGDMVFNTYVSDSQAIIVWATGLTDSNYWVKSSGTFVTLNGTVSSNAKAGTTADLKAVAVGRPEYPNGGDNTDILFSAVGTDGVSTDYKAAITNGAVTIGGGTDEIKWGDVDCNDKVNVADAILLAQYSAEIAGTQVSAQGLLNANVYYDNLTNGDDVSVLLELLAGLRKDEDMPYQP